MLSAPPAPVAAPIRLNPDVHALIPGLALSVADGAARRRGAVQLSAGTQDAHDAGLLGYADRSFVPRLPWRAPTDEEWATLTRPERMPEGWIDPPGDRVSVFRVPESVLEPFAQLRKLCHQDGSLKRIQALSQDAAGRTALMEAARHALRLTYADRADLDAPNAYAKIPPGTPTMTAGRDGRLTGLHVDNWYRRALEERAFSPNRISINLGARDRHLLYVNLPLRTIAELVAEARGGAHVDDVAFTLPREFTRLFPGYPVVKLAIAPGEAYIAPTENIIHDGYAERSGAVDLHFTCRGYFRAPRP
jgi:hypothetical protein